MTGPVGGFVVRRARLVLVVAVLAVVGFGVLGLGAAIPDSADPALARPTAQRLSVVSAADPRSAAAQDLVRAVRGLPGPGGAGVYVGGQTAELIVRAVLVPACQRILGRAGWYAPAPLRRLNTRIRPTEARG